MDIDAGSGGALLSVLVGLVGTAITICWGTVAAWAFIKHLNAPRDEGA